VLAGLSTGVSASARTWVEGTVLGRWQVRGQGPARGTTCMTVI